MRYGRDVVEATLASIGVDVVRVNRQGWGMARCPLHDDKDPSFAVHMEEGGWRCRAGCGSSGDLAVLVEAVTGAPVADVRRELIHGMAPTDSELEDALDPDEDEAASAVPLFYDRSQCPKYMADRGFSVDTLKEWRVGWDPEDRSAVIPARDESGRLVGLVRRRVDGRSPKYVNTPGEWRSEILFGLDMARPGDTVWIVEGPLDAMWLWQHGEPAVALLGSSMSERQRDLVARRYRRAILAFDRDKAGDACAAQVAQLLAGLDLLSAGLPEKDGGGFKDVQECSPEEISAVRSTAAAIWV